MPRPIFTLQRLAHALGAGRNRLRTTDWWAILLEIGVVVLGILIAFELQEWGTNRQKRKDEALHLQRIEEEAAADFRAIRDIWRQHHDSASRAGPGGASRVPPQRGDRLQPPAHAGRAPLLGQRRRTGWRRPA